MGSDLTVLRTKGECKAFFGGKPEHTWLFRADRNMPRKRYGSMFRAVAPLLAAIPELFMIYHCQTIDGGGDLEDEKSHYPPHIAAKMISTGIHDSVGGAPRELLNVLYNAADLYLSTSAEGFGLTIAESMACGTPAVGLHYSSVPEVIGNLTGSPGPGAGGVTVPVGMLVENQYSHFWAGIDEPAFTRAVERLIRHPKQMRQLGFTATGHVNRTFTWQKAAAQMSELFAVRQEIAA
jgi:glycosyltransferase involved in cell wall biosynthesis